MLSKFVVYYSDKFITYVYMCIYVYTYYFG